LRGERRGSIEVGYRDFGRRPIRRKSVATLLFRNAAAGIELSLRNPKIRLGEAYLSIATSILGSRKIEQAGTWICSF
jgi:hypothetical protein